MKGWLRLVLMVALSGAATLMAREEMLPLTESRSVSITVPDGFTYKAGANASGALGITLVNADETVSLTVSFEPDLENAFREERARTERLHEEFSSFVPDSVEKAMQFEELQPKIGAGTYCVFTDAKLVGKPASEYPKGEYLHVTVGVKAWPGIVATFTLFANDLKSEQHQALMKVLRESVHEKPAPLL